MHVPPDHLALRRSRYEHATSIALVLGSACYFALGLGARELSLLESQDLGVACDLFRTFEISSDHSPLHFAFLSLWQRLAPHSDVFLRLPSLAFAALATGFVYRLTRRLSGAIAGVLAGCWFATNPYVVDQAHSLRLYALCLLLAAACLERAHAYASGQETRRALVAFTLSALLAVYTHLFLWLLVGPVALALALVTRSREPEARRFALRCAVTGGLASVPQLIHGFGAVAFTHERHAIYRGVSSGASRFFAEVGRVLLLGESDTVTGVPSYALLVPVAFALWGAHRLGKREKFAACLVFGPALAVSWGLSATSEVEARYLGFLLPGLAALTAIGLSGLPRFGSYPVATSCAAAGLLAASLFATQRAYPSTATDWNAGAARLEALRLPDEPVAVFPSYWAATLQRYGTRADLVPIKYPIDLERVLARGHGALLVINGGRYFGDMEAYLRANTQRVPLFSTHVRDTFRVVRVQPSSAQAQAPPADPAALVFAGLVGSGGYAWQREPAADNPFAALRGLFTSGAAALTAFAPYDPPWPATLLLGGGASRLRPNPQVARALQEAGVKAVALACAQGGPESARGVLHDARLATVPVTREAAGIEPLVYEIQDTRVGMLSLGDGAGEPARIEPSALARIVSHGRERVGAQGALVVFVPQAPDYARWPSGAERALARRLIDLGADLVLGIGGYAAKPIEIYRRGVIAYSLGTLLRPASFSLASSDSSGLALQVHIDAQRPLRVEARAVTFDDQARPHLGDPRALDGVLPAFEPSRGPGAVPAIALSDKIARAQASYTTSAGVVHRLGRVSSAISTPLERWLWSHTRAFTEWIPQSAIIGELRPFLAAVGDGASYFGVRGVRSLGQLRDAVELDVPGGATGFVEFPRVRLGARLTLAYGLSDDRVKSKFIPLLAETVLVAIDQRELWSQTIPFHVGWHLANIDTSAFAGMPAHVRIGLRAPASHFPVAFEAIVQPGRVAPDDQSAPVAADLHRY